MPRFWLAHLKQTILFQKSQELQTIVGKSTKIFEATLHDVQNIKFTSFTIEQRFHEKLVERVMLAKV